MHFLHSTDGRMSYFDTFTLFAIDVDIWLVVMYPNKKKIAFFISDRGRKIVKAK